MKKIPLLLLLCMICVSCAAPILVSPTGNSLPIPSYSLYDTSGLGYKVTFYYSAIEAEEDLDKTIQYYPTYLDMEKKHNLSISNYEKILLTVEVWNTQKREFKLSELTSTSLKNGETIQSDLDIVHSKLPYRKVTIKLPFYENIEDVTYLLKFYDKKGLLFVLGDFSYKIVK